MKTKKPKTKSFKITFFDIKPGESTYLKSKLKNHKLQFSPESISEKNIALAKDSDIISVFIGSKVDKKLIAKMKKLKLIVTRSTGFDHIDLKECAKRKVMVSNVPYYGENTVAEHTFALILSLSRNIHKSYLRTLKDDFSIDGLSGFDLKGKTIGIIGGGNIGLHVARIARAFAMHVRVYDTRQNDFMAEVVNFKYIGLNELLKTSDIISLHLPHNESTHHLIDRAALAKMKKGSILINTARGAIVDTDSLYNALKNKKLAGAGLDVIEGEEFISEDQELLHQTANQANWEAVVRNNKIFDMDNVVFTPHNAFNSKEALKRILDTSLDNIKNFIEGDPSNPVL